MRPPITAGPMLRNSRLFSAAIAEAGSPAGEGARRVAAAARDEPGSGSGAAFVPLNFLAIARLAPSARLSARAAATMRRVAEMRVTRSIIEIPLYAGLGQFRRKQ